MLAAQAPWWEPGTARATTPQPGHLVARCCGASMAVRSGASSPRRWPAPSGRLPHRARPSDDHRCPTSSRPRRSTSTSPRSTWTAWRSDLYRPAPTPRGQHHRMAAGGDRAANGTAMPLGGAHPGRRGQRRHARRRLAALAVDRRPHLPRAVQRRGLVLGLRCASGSATASPTRRPLHSCRRGASATGWLGRVGHHRRRGAPPDHRLCDEQDGGRPGGRPARVQPRDRCLRGAGL